MKKYFIPLMIFLAAFCVYFGMATNFTFHPKWAVDYFNPLAVSLVHGRLDLVNPAETYDLSHFKGKWYAPWGALPSILLIFPQFFLKRFVPAIYLSVLFASLDIVLIYFLLKRLKREFFPEFSDFSQLLVLILFAFGTVHFYVGTLGSVWHVDQMVTNFLGTLGLFIIFKKNRQTKDYLISAWIFSLALLGRAPIAFLIVLPIFFYIYQYKTWQINQHAEDLKRGLIIFIIPVALFSGLFFIYNYLRFQNPLEFGYSYIKESPYLAALRKTHGAISFRNIPRNLWYMLFEIPKLSLDGKLKLNFNLNGNSIFFLSPPLLAAILASPIVKKAKRWLLDPYVTGLWLAAVIVTLPSLLIYSTGWMQFSYRYSLDITAILVLLSIFGMKGKLNILYILGIIFSIVMYVLGIKSLM